MKRYTALEIKILKLSEKDIICTSGENEGRPDIEFGENELPLVPIFH